MSVKDLMLRIQELFEAKRQTGGEVHQLYAEAVRQALGEQLA